MSDSDQSDDRGFLARWSQRKQQARQPAAETPAGDAAHGAAASPPASADEPEPPFDLSTLPSLDELTAKTDITAFLRKGVPDHLRNAALRKSWALDPAIRNYVSPALEYAYDWNAPGGVPGGGELGPGVDLARMVEQIMGTSPSPAEPAGASPDVPAPGPEVAAPAAPDLPEQSLRVGDSKTDAAPPSSLESRRQMAPDASATGDDLAASQHEVRRHGSAKPVV